MLGRAKDWCLMCELEKHATLLTESGGPLSPSRILTNMRNINCQIGDGSQEDAHEFLRYQLLHLLSFYARVFLPNLNIEQGNFTCFFMFADSLCFLYRLQQSKCFKECHNSFSAYICNTMYVSLRNVPM